MLHINRRRSSVASFPPFLTNHTLITGHTDRQLQKVVRTLVKQVGTPPRHEVITVLLQQQLEHKHDIHGASWTVRRRNIVTFSPYQPPPPPPQKKKKKKKKKSLFHPLPRKYTLYPSEKVGFPFLLFCF